MPYNFKEVTIYIFDIHPAVGLLTNALETAFQKDFGFLAKPEQYEKLYLSNSRLETGNLVFEPLSGYEQTKSHFWEPFKTIWQKDHQPDIWKVQLPFATTQIKADLKLNTQLPGVAATIHPKIYLSALGWATDLKIHLNGDIEETSLISLLGQLMKGSDQVFPLAVNGEPKGRVDTFRFFNDLMRNEVYQPAQPPHPGMKIFRQFVISLDRYEGGQNPYADMTAPEQALMLSVLYGEEIKPADKIKKEKNSPVTRTDISNYGLNFALSNFEHGTLIFLQKLAQEQQTPKDNKKASCIAANIKNCIMNSYLLWRFYEDGKGENTNAEFAALRNNVGGTLKGIPRAYRNQFCQNLFLQHAALSKLANS
jgi:hypothetical protein